MTPVVAVIAPGMMGAAVGKRLVDNGLKVLTTLKGRSAETVARAKTAGMLAASDEEIAATDFILAILPPGHAVALAPTGAPYVDVGIIGGPPKPGDAGPRFYASGKEAPRFATLKQYGLDVRVLEGELTAASALKMSYAGMTKGTQAINAVMLLAATREGTADALLAELQKSQPQMLAWLKSYLGTMPPKAYRWVAEMHEIADFVGDDPSGHELYVGAAHFYEQFARDFETDKEADAALKKFFAKM